MMRKGMLLIGMLLIEPWVPLARADVSSHAVRKTTEFVLKKFGKEAAEQGTEVLSHRIGSLAARYGDEALDAFRKVGPKVARLADDAGEQADVAVRLLAKRGDNALRLVSQPRQLKLIGQLGDDAAESLLKHGTAVESVLSSHGTHAANALQNLSSQNGRRVAMMATDGELTKLGRANELLEVITRYGDAGAEFLWRNKGGLLVGSALASFLAAPEMFIEGGKDLSLIVAEAAVQPVVEAAADCVPWGLVVIAIVVLVGIAVAIWTTPRFLIQKALTTFPARCNGVDPKSKNRDQSWQS